MLTCKEVARTIAADELAAADWRRRLSVRFHLFICRHCRRYAAQIRTLGAGVRHVLDDEIPDAASRERLRQSILERIHHEE